MEGIDRHHRKSCATACMLALAVAITSGHATAGTERVNLASDGTQADETGFVRPAASGDGRYVVFSSLASNLVPGDTNNSHDVFVRDRRLRTTQRVSVTGGFGTQGDGDSEIVGAITSDGRFVVFASSATNL